MGTAIAGGSMNKPESVPGCGNAANNALFLRLVRLGGVSICPRIKKACLISSMIL